ncbi:DEAD/SNF2-like helicase [Hokovirus HKV1]|uniref:DEAD/SNF2-like helicase n=1 Tax=Hokovirus HKV1 TaxID=1977638 RepID=A0A1V0SGI1_9VIRU|nr:DEAD/SNF2-like helicase [Hokovirus HKV1]
MPINKNKVNNIIDTIIDNQEANWNDVFNIDEDITGKLHDYQLCNLYEMLTLFEYNDVILNGSDTGTGKTYVSGALLKKKEDYKAIIICLKTAISYWKMVLDYFNVEPLFIINYDAIIEGKYLKNGKLEKCPYLDINHGIFKWNVNKKVIFIFDEAHKCKNSKTLHGKLLLSTKNKGKVLLLSATISARAQDFAIFGYMLNLYNPLNVGRKWINNLLEQDNRMLIKPLISSLTSKIYPDKGAKMSILELGDRFPKNNVIPLPIDLDNNLIEEYDNYYTMKNNDIQNIMKIRVILEKYKTEPLAKIAKDFIDDGLNVVIFLNYTESIMKIAKLLGTDNILYGKTPIEKRDELINDFQSNKINLLICNSKIGGESIGLHDLHGKQRVSLISNSFSGIELKQILGRIYRVGSLTPALQYIVYFANTLEKEIYYLAKNKISFIDNLNEQEIGYLMIN